MELYTIDELSKETTLEKLELLYGDESVENISRIEVIANQLYQLTGKKEFGIFSAPGRVEICGNHTDHNNGKVLAAAVNMDMLGVAVPNKLPEVKISSTGFSKTFEADISGDKPSKSEKGSTEAIIKGVAAGLRLKGYKTGGFTACIDSKVLPGSGLSSSAAIEVLVGTIFNGIYNGGRISPLEIALTGQYAENTFFMKASGLMDQLASASGSGIFIDFLNPYEPLIELIETDFNRFGYSLLVAKTHGRHDNLVPEYESIPTEMKRVAAFFGYDNCRSLNRKDLIDNFSTLRSKCGDRALLRTIHFIEENLRVERSVEALKKRDSAGFLDQINQSGLSSLLKLQNCCVPERSFNQELLMALEMTRDFITDSGVNGSCKVNGGGFAGTILVFLPSTAIDSYKTAMAPIVGENSIVELKIRNTGAYIF